MVCKVFVHLTWTCWAPNSAHLGSTPCLTIEHATPCRILPGRRGRRLEVAGSIAKEGHALKPGGIGFSKLVRTVMTFPGEASAANHDKHVPMFLWQTRIHYRKNLASGISNRSSKDSRYI